MDRGGQRHVDRRGHRLRRRRPHGGARRARRAHDVEDRDDPAGPRFDPTREDPFAGQFTVRLTVTSSEGEALPGVDRKVLTALEDDTLRDGFPKRMGAGGEAPLRYADLDGDGTQELVLPSQDGFVHAYRPDGSELPGWPVRTELQFAARAHLGSPRAAGARGPARAAAGADDRRPDRRRAPRGHHRRGRAPVRWRADGTTLPGWPVHPDPTRANCAPSEQERDRKHPKCGFVASPAIARFEGADGPPSVVVAGLDGRLRAHRPDGSAVPGFPVRLIDPNVPENEQMTAESINNAAIGDLDGDGRDDVVVATNEVYGGAGGGGDVVFDGLSNAAGTTSRVYAVGGRTADLPPRLADRPAGSSRTSCRSSAPATTRRSATATSRASSCRPPAGRWPSTGPTARANARSSSRARRARAP